MRRLSSIALVFAVIAGGNGNAAGDKREIRDVPPGLGGELLYEEGDGYLQYDKFEHGTVLGWAVDAPLDGRESVRVTVAMSVKGKATWKRRRQKLKSSKVVLVAFSFIGETTLEQSHKVIMLLGKKRIRPDAAHASTWDKDCACSIETVVVLLKRSEFKKFATAKSVDIRIGGIDFSITHDYRWGFRDLLGIKRNPLPKIFAEDSPPVLEGAPKERPCEDYADCELGWLCSTERDGKTPGTCYKRNCYTDDDCTSPKKCMHGRCNSVIDPFK